MEEEVEMQEVVIVGAGISGLATALALHRKGIKSVVVEKSHALRNTSGTAIGIRQNGWRALDQLGLAHTLRHTAFPIQMERDVWLDDDPKEQERPMGGETRCLRRRDLIDALYAALPLGTVEFGCQLTSVSPHSHTSYPLLQFRDRPMIIAKVVIGCDGAKSIIADFLELNPTNMFSLCGVRGLTNYPNAHSFAHEFVRFRKRQILVGRIPIDANSVYWFSAQHYFSTDADAEIFQDPELIRKSTLESLDGFPQEIQEMVRNANTDSLSLSHLRYRAPWHLLMGTFRKGTVTVAGDAMHVMGPFLGQGGSAGLEDAVVLARSLAQAGLRFNPIECTRKVVVQKVGKALDHYVQQRRMRIVLLSMQTYLTGILFENPSRLKKMICIAIMILLFRDSSGHTNYDCGVL